MTRQLTVAMALCLLASCGVGSDADALDASNDEAGQAGQALNGECSSTGWGYVVYPGTRIFASYTPTTVVGTVDVGCATYCSLLQRCPTSSFYRVYCVQQYDGPGGCPAPGKVLNGWVWGPSLH